MPGPDTVRRFQEGDPAALEALIHEYGPPLFRYLSLIAGNAEVARDIAQATFVTAFERRSTLNDPEKFRPWLFTIGRRKARREVTRIGRRGEVSLDAPVSSGGESFYGAGIEDDAPGAREKVADTRARRVLNEELERLDEESRYLILGHFLDGRSTKELAEELDIPYGTACTRIFRGLRIIREAFEERGVKVDDFIS